MSNMEPSRKAERDEKGPEFDVWDDPSTAVSGDRTRDDFLDVALQLREPVTVPEIAERAGRGEDSARDYMRFFAELGVVEKVTERPERYRVNREYLRWRQIRRVKKEHDADKIAELLSEVTDRIDGYRDEFGADSPDELSVLEYADESGKDAEEVWQKLTEWKTEVERRKILDEALRSAEEPAFV
jgi:DNA-binding transcriptional regulator GbsR (MarR family)